jgi:hypothetical protein
MGLTPRTAPELPYCARQPSALRALCAHGQCAVSDRDRSGVCTCFAGATSCGDHDAASPSSAGSERRVTYSGEVLTEADGQALRVSVDLVLTTFETGGDAGDGLVYGGFGAQGTIEVTNASDRDFTVPPERVSVSIYDSPASWACDNHSSVFPDLCLVSALITEQADATQGGDSLAPGESLKFGVGGRTAEGRFALGMSPKLANALTEAFNAGSGPAAVTLWGGPVEKPWRAACGEQSGPFAVFLADGTLIGPSQGR